MFRRTGLLSIAALIALVPAVALAQQATSNEDAPAPAAKPSRIVIKPAAGKAVGGAQKSNLGATANDKASAGKMERFAGNWIEGPGYDITYGADYDTCARRCLEASKCMMIEYYRPEKKCNMYDKKRPLLKGGSSDVAQKI